MILSTLQQRVLRCIHLRALTTTVATSGVGSFAQRRPCAADGRTESPPRAQQQRHNAAEKDHPPAGSGSGSGAFDSKPAQPDSDRVRSEPSSPRARPTTNAKAEPATATARPAATEPPPPAHAHHRASAHEPHPPPPPHRSEPTGRREREHPGRRGRR